jgi:hypothetical protein
MRIALIDTSGATRENIGVILSVHFNYVDAGKAQELHRNLSYRCGARAQTKVVAVQGELVPGDVVTNSDLAESVR